MQHVLSFRTPCFHLRLTTCDNPLWLCLSAAATALLVLGSVCFLPGFYHTRIAYLAWKGVQGYTLDSIPDF
jgi:hypothetical protein